jgi:hypothetical protein
VNPGPVATEWLARCLDHLPGEAEVGLRLSPGVDADRVAAAVHRALPSGRSSTTAVPRFYGLGRRLSVQPLRLVTDVLLGASARRLAVVADRMAHDRTPGAGDDEVDPPVAGGFAPPPR